MPRSKSGGKTECMVHSITWTLTPYSHSPSHQGRLVLPDSFPAYIGRDPQLDLRIAYPTVSLVHAEFFAAGGRLWIRDLSSRNGTFVNGQRLTESHPLALGDVIQFGSVAFRLEKFDDHFLDETQCCADDDMALAVSQFDRLLLERRLVPFYQPILPSRGETPLAYEVLARSGLYGLRTPLELFRTAAVLCRTNELSHLCRLEGVTGSPADLSPHLFLNTSPLELSELPLLLKSLDQIRDLRPHQPLTLEVHESALMDTAALATLSRALEERKIHLAFDDFGSGESRLAELVDARPKFVKFDRRLCAVDHLSCGDGRRLLAALLRMVHDLGIVSVAEGIETGTAATICRELGFQLLQGFYFGVPARASVWFKRQPAAEEAIAVEPTGGELPVPACPLPSEA